MFRALSSFTAKKKQERTDDAGGKKKTAQPQPGTSAEKPDAAIPDDGMTARGTTNRKWYRPLGKKTEVSEKTNIVPSATGEAAQKAAEPDTASAPSISDQRHAPAKLKKAKKETDTGMAKPVKRPWYSVLAGPLNALKRAESSATQHSPVQRPFLENLVRTPSGAYCTINGRLYILDSNSKVPRWNPGPDIDVATLAAGANNQLTAFTRSGKLVELLPNGHVSNAFKEISLPEGTSSFAVSLKGSIAFTSTTHPGEIGYLDYTDRQNANTENIVWQKLPHVQSTKDTTGNPEIQSMLFTRDGKLLLLDSRNTIWEGSRPEDGKSHEMAWKESHGLPMKEMPPVPKKLKTVHPKQVLLNLKKENIFRDGVLIEQKANGEQSKFKPMPMPVGTYDFAASSDGSLAIVSDRKASGGKHGRRGQIGFLHYQYRNAENPLNHIRWIDLPDEAVNLERRRNIKEINFSFSGGIELRTRNGVQWKSTALPDVGAPEWHSSRLFGKDCYDFAVSADGATVAASTTSPNAIVYMPRLRDGQRSNAYPIALPEVFPQSDGKPIGFMSFDKDGWLLLHDKAGRRWRGRPESAQKDANGIGHIKWEALQAEAAVTRPHAKVAGPLPRMLTRTITKAQPQLPVVPPAPVPVRLIHHVNGQIGGLDADNRMLMRELDGRWSHAGADAPNALVRFFNGYKEQPAGNVAVNGLGLVHGAQNWRKQNRSAWEWTVPLWAVQQYPGENRILRWKKWLKGGFEIISRRSEENVNKDIEQARRNVLDHIAETASDAPGDSNLGSETSAAAEWINNQALTCLTLIDEQTGTPVQSSTNNRRDQALVETLHEDHREAGHASELANAVSSSPAARPGLHDAAANKLNEKTANALKHAAKKLEKRKQEIARNYQAPRAQVESDENALYVLRQARQALGHDENDPVNQLLDEMLRRNKFLAFDGDRHIQVGSTDNPLPLKLHRNEIATNSSYLLLLHNFLLGSNRADMGVGSASDNHFSLVLAPNRVSGNDADGLEVQASYDLVKKPTAELREDDIVIARNAQGTIADTARLLKSFYENNISDLNLVISHKDAWDFFRQALSSDGLSYRIERLLTGQYLLGVEPSRYGLAGTYGVKDIHATYRQFFMLMPVGSSLSIALDKMLGLDLEGSSLFVKTGAHQVTKAVSAQTFAIEPISALSTTRSHKLTIAANADSYDVAVSCSRQINANIIAAKIQIGIGASVNNASSLNPVPGLIAFVYLGGNTKIKLAGYVRDITEKILFKILRDDRGAAEALVEKVMRGEISLTDMAKSDIDQMISTRTVTNTFTFNLDFEPLLASGLIVPKNIGDNRNFLWKYIFGPAVLQVNYAAKMVHGVTTTLGGGKITITFHNSENHELFATYIGVHELQANAGQHDPAGPTREFDPQQKAWLPFFGIIHLQKKLLGQATEQDGFTVTFNPKTKRIEAINFTVSAVPPATGNSKGIKPLRKEYLDTNSDITEEKIPALKALLMVHPELKKPLEKLKASKTPVSITLEMRPGMLDRINQAISILDGKGVVYTLDELIMNFLVVPGSVRITNFSVTETHKYETSNTSGLSAARFVNKGAINLSVPSASINIKYSNEGDAETSRIILGGSLAENQRDAGTDLIERIHLEGGADLWDFLHNPIGDNSERMKYAARINTILIGMRRSESLLDDEEYLNQIKTLEEQIEASTKVNVDSTVDAFKTSEDKMRIYTSAKALFVDATNRAIDAKINALELNWDQFNRNPGAEITTALRAYFSKADGSLDRVRILQLLNDPDMLLTFMSSICRYTGHELPEDAQRLVAGDTSTADALAASQTSVKKEGLLRSTYNRLRGRHERSLGIPAETSGEGSLTTDAPAATGSIPSQGATGSSGSAGRSSMAVSQVEVTTVGGGLPGLGAIPGTSISAPSGHLAPPSIRVRTASINEDAVSGRSRYTSKSTGGGSSEYGKVQPRSPRSTRTGYSIETDAGGLSPKDASIARMPSNISGRSQPNAANLPALPELGDEVRFFVEQSQLPVNWNFRRGGYRSLEEMASHLREFLSQQLANEILTEVERDMLERLGDIQDDAELLAEAGISTTEGLPMIRFRNNQTRALDPYVTAYLNEALNTPLADNGTYAALSIALSRNSEIEWTASELQERAVDQISRFPALVSNWAFDLLQPDPETYDEQKMQEFIRNIIRAIMNPNNIPADENVPSLDRLNLSGILLTAIGMATRTTIRVEGIDSQPVRFGRGSLIPRANFVLPFDEREIGVRYADGEYLMIETD